jgi:ABC-2 type transport system permease protein
MTGTAPAIRPAPALQFGEKPHWRWFGPGSVPWLLRHDLRLAGRGMRATGTRGGAVAATVLLITIAVLHLLGFAAAPALSALHDRFRADAMLTGSIALACLFALFLSKSITEATEALYQRGDLDLLLSSPLPMRRVLATRLLAIAVIAAFMPILLVLPMANGMVLRGYLAWIGVYPVLGGLSLTAAAAGAGLTFGLLAWLGPRWTTFAARALATLFGAASFLFAQIRFLMSDSTRKAVWQAMLPAANGTGGWFGSPGWWPARALMGEALPMLAMAALGVAAVIGVSAALGQAYGSGVMGHLAAGRATPAAGLAAGRFRRGQFAALLRKEWLLLLRHPGLGAQLFYQFIFLVPGTIALLQIGEATGSRSSAGVVFLTAMMTGRIARVIAVGPFETDDAAALAATAPVPFRDTVRAKLIVTAALLALVIGASLAGVWMQKPAALPAATLASIAAAITRVRLSMARPRQLRRAGLQGRLPGHAGGVLGVMIDLAWGFGGALLSFVL